MSQKDDTFSTQHISPELVSQVIEAIRNKAYGSVEIYISNYRVTQITERVIHKVSKRENSINRPVEEPEDLPQESVR